MATIAQNLARIKSDRNRIRNKLVSMEKATGNENLDQLTSIIEALTPGDFTMQGNIEPAGHLTYSFNTLTGVFTIDGDGVNTTYAPSVGIGANLLAPYIQTITFTNTARPTSLNNWFRNCTFGHVVITNIPQSVTSMDDIFYQSTFASLTIQSTNTLSSVRGYFNEITAGTADFSQWYLSGFTDAYAAFQSSNIDTFDISGWDMSTVTNLSYMFEALNGRLADPGTLIHTNWNTVSAVDMSYMFRNANVEVDLSTLVTSNVTTMREMFYNFKGTEIDVSNFNTGNVTTFQDTFRGVILDSLDISDFDTGKTTGINGMFRDAYIKELTIDFNLPVCETADNLYNGFRHDMEELPLDGFDTLPNDKNVNLEAMCANTSGAVDLTKINFTGVNYMRSMFYGYIGDSLDFSVIGRFPNLYGEYCVQYLMQNANIGSVDLSGVKFGTAGSLYEMFYNAEIGTIDFTDFDCESIRGMDYMFCYTKINIIDLTGIKNTFNVENMRAMFYGLRGTTNIIFDNAFDTSKVTNMREMFTRSSSSVASQLTSLDLSSFNTSRVTDMYCMLNSLDNCVTILVSQNFIVTQVSNSSYMFNSSTRLVGGNGTQYNGSYTDKTYARIDAPGTPGYFTEKVVTTDNYTVTYNANGNTGTMSSQTILTNEPTRLSRCTFTNSDTKKIFKGWATSSSGSVVYADQEYVTNIAATGSSIELFAVFEEMTLSDMLVQVYDGTFNNGKVISGNQMTGYTSGYGGILLNTRGNAITITATSTSENSGQYGTGSTSCRLPMVSINGTNRSSYTNFSNQTTVTANISPSNTQYAYFAWHTPQDGESRTYEITVNWR